MDYVGVGEQLATLTEHVRGVDVRVAELGQACKDLADTTVSEKMCQERCGGKRDRVMAMSAIAVALISFAATVAAALIK